jgi:hypothetical protein
MKGKIIKKDGCQGRTSRKDRREHIEEGGTPRKNNGGRISRKEGCRKKDQPNKQNNRTPEQQKEERKKNGEMERRN